MASKVAPARTADTMLRRIEQFLAAAPRREARRLWDVLCALRGPDHGEDGLFVKRMTTARIRTLAFPRLANDSKEDFSQGALYASRTDAAVNPIDTSASLSPHFNGHVAVAAFALSAMGRIAGAKKGS